MSTNPTPPALSARDDSRRRAVPSRSAVPDRRRTAGAGGTRRPAPEGRRPSRRASGTRDRDAALSGGDEGEARRRRRGGRVCGQAAAEAAHGRIGGEARRGGGGGASLLRGRRRPERGPAARLRDSAPLPRPRARRRGTGTPTHAGERTPLGTGHGAGELPGARGRRRLDRGRVERRTRRHALLRDWRR
jgi:hypothetical protein